jgi:ribosomal protein L11 methylase PrmA
LVASGILDEQVAEVVETLAANGLRVTERRMSQEWAALIAKPAG